LHETKLENSIEPTTTTVSSTIRAQALD